MFKNSGTVLIAIPATPATPATQKRESWLYIKLLLNINFILILYIHIYMYYSVFHHEPLPFNWNISKTKLAGYSRRFLKLKYKKFYDIDHPGATYINVISMDTLADMSYSMNKMSKVNTICNNFIKERMNFNMASRSLSSDIWFSHK